MGITTSEMMMGIGVIRADRNHAVVAIKERKMLVHIPEMVRVSRGTFSMGSPVFPDSLPIRNVTLNDYAIGKYPITNLEYNCFLQIMERKIPFDPENLSDPEFAFHPAVTLSWNDATEYCSFLSRITSRSFRLPTEAEWEFAARGIEGREFPWGNESPDYGQIHLRAEMFDAVTQHPLGATPSGIFDMVGNIRQWVEDWYANEYDPKNLIDPKGPEKGDRKVLRGASFYDPSYASYDYLRAAIRNSYDPNHQSESIGFRVVEDVNSTSTI